MLDNIAPTEMVCACCADRVPADEIQWEVRSETGITLCISCDFEDWLFDEGIGDSI